MGGKTGTSEDGVNTGKTYSIICRCSRRYRP